MKLDERRAALHPIPAVTNRIERRKLRRQPEKPRWTSEIQTVR
jgi:hypothetical protein